MSLDPSICGGAARLNQAATDCEEEGRLAEAVALYEAASRAAPEWGVPWYNRGLLYKRQRSWDKSLRYNRKAVQLSPGEGDPAWWNLGIAATALGDWPTARAAWKAFGLEISEGEGPIEEDYGLVPIRIRPDDLGETIWSRRIDPARAILENVPFPDSGHRWRDLVLHDGAPNGHRMLHGEEVPVFDGLDLLAPSPFSTFVAAVSAVSPETAEALIGLLDQLPDVLAEDWTGNVRFLCRACSEGRPHDHHDHAVAGTKAWNPERRIGIAARTADAVQAVLAEWCHAGKGSLTSFEC